MAHPAQIKIPATYIRGGTSKGVFFRLQDLPASDVGGGDLDLCGMSHHTLLQFT